MKKLIFMISLMVFCAVPALARAEAEKTSQPYLFKSGKVDIFIPAPTDKFVEVGYANKGFLWKIVRSKDLSNGLFVLKSDFNDVMDGVSNADIEYSSLSKYASIEIKEEVTRLDSVAFKAIVGKAQSEVGDNLTSNKIEPEKMLLQRVKALHQKGEKLAPRTSLGRLFSKPNAYSYGVLIKTQTDGKASYIVAGFTMIHVNNKMLSTYLYARYEGKDTLRWLQKTTEAWSDNILKANSLPMAQRPKWNLGELSSRKSY